MNSEQIRIAKKTFQAAGYTEFTEATDAVRIAKPGRHGELLAIHAEHGEFVLYLRMGGEQLLRAKRILRDAVSAKVDFKDEALAVRGLSPQKLPVALSETLASLPQIAEFLAQE